MKQVFSLHFTNKEELVTHFGVKHLIPKPMFLPLHVGHCTVMKWIKYVPKRLTGSQAGLCKGNQITGGDTNTPWTVQAEYAIRRWRWLEPNWKHTFLSLALPLPLAQFFRCLLL